jgi:nitroreductase
MNGEAMIGLLRARRSVRQFTSRPIPRELLARLVEAATLAPSATNRQPWRYAVVTSAAKIRGLQDAVRHKLEQMAELVRQGHHGDDLGNYWDYFHQALCSATAVIVPQYRVHPDLIAQLLESGGADASEWNTSQSMQVELCATSAGVMALLLQAQAEGLAGCWMSGPMVARAELAALLEIREPWNILGLVALGYPSATPPPTPRRAVSQVTQWWEDT